MAQAQYLIEATRKCATHPPGSRIIYTGPRSGVAKGWRIIRRYRWQEPAWSPIV